MVRNHRLLALSGSTVPAWWSGSNHLPTVWGPLAPSDTPSNHEGGTLSTAVVTPIFDRKPALDTEGSVSFDKNHHKHPTLTSLAFPW